MVGVLFAQRFKLLVRISSFRLFFQHIHHGMPHGVGKRGFFTPQDVLRQQIAFKSLPQKILAHAVGIHLQLGVDGHDVAHKIQVAEGHARFQGVGRYTPVRAQYVVHMQLAHALFALLLERLRARRKVRILVAEELVRDLAREQHAHVGGAADGAADEVHAHARPNRGYIECGEVAYNLVKRGEHVV